METVEIIAYAMSIVAAYLFLRLFQETITRKNAIDKLDSADLTIATITKTLNTSQRERDTFKCELERANQTIGVMMGDLSIVRMERQGVVEELEKVAKERDELQAKACELKTNDIELLNLKIYKERVLTRLKSIIDDEVDE